MNKIDCLSEKFSARTLGVFLLPFTLFLAFIGGLVLPVIGFFFALPLVIMSGTLIFAPESKACQLITDSANKTISKGKSK